MCEKIASDFCDVHCFASESPPQLIYISIEYIIYQLFEWLLLAIRPVANIPCMFKMTKQDL